ncbi:STP1 protein [Plasmodium malariae]|uniref:STP1 protein n=1 Tax=Plasmodium malariae TaxID=5858 RepID=A0A1D3JHS9_PLAMA|nr:STP1 protein [Plasmodium malariae]SBT85932.1 STP1 protein [Plasmodium malariae]
MEGCLSSNLMVLGTGALEMYMYQEFIRIVQHVNQTTTSLNNENNKENFRTKCLQLADYLIQHKTPPRYYLQGKEKWEGTLKGRLNSYFTPLILKYGGCFPILDNNEKQILDLNYKALNLCDEIKKRQEEIQCIKGKRIISDKCDETCSNKINEYNVWISNEKVNFNNKKELLIHNCKNVPSQFPTKKCDIVNPGTFSELPECTVKYSVARTQPESAEKKTIPPDVDQTTDSVQSIPQDSQKQDSQLISGEKEKIEVQTEQEKVRPDLQSQTDELSSTKATSTQGDIRDNKDPQPRKEQASAASENEEVISSDGSTFSSKSEESVVPPRFETTPLSIPAPLSLTPSLSSISSGQVVKKSNSHTSSILISIIIIIVFSFFIKYALIGMFKKKKNIKRKQMKFLRIKVPSRFDKKSKFFTDDHLERAIYDDEEIIKKIKINERTKKVNLSKQKKDRSKIIIEVHMEVLEECINEDWENHKDEFLEICIDEFAKKDYTTYPNLKDDDPIIENVKCISDIKKQNILWNKWIQRYRNLSQNLKKDDWFNNLKDEWKREVAYIQEMEEIKKKYSNENQKVSYLEREKDIWRQWISKKGMIIQQHLDQYWNNGLAEELQNISDEYVNEDTKNYVSLLNVEELQHKENYEELCKYIKKKLLTKFCILVLITVLEEYKNEVNLENRESYLDRSINEWKGEGYSSKKQEITENIIEYNKNDIENKRNEEFDAHIWKACFRDEIEDWIREDDLYANSIVSDRTVDKSDEIEEKQFL